MKMKLSLNIRRAGGLLLLLMAALFPFLGWDRALHFYYLYLCGAYAVVLFITGLILVMMKD